MTNVLIISDVHANIIALEAVLADAGKVDEVWCLGDIAGYGPNPNECIERIRNLPNLTCMMGNHDFAALGDIALETFNPDAKKALLWQRDQLTEANKDFLRTMSQKPVLCGNVTLVHGSPRDPIWEYIMNTLVARMNLDYYETLWCFMGHSHFQAVFQYHSETDEVIIEIGRAHV
jgi:predicted phosphodiesterase